MPSCELRETPALKSCVLHAAKALRIEDRPVPEVGPDQVRLKIGAGGICGSDLHY